MIPTLGTRTKQLETTGDRTVIGWIPNTCCFIGDKITSGEMRSFEAVNELLVTCYWLS